VRIKGKEAQYWEGVAKSGRNTAFSNKILAENKKRIYLDLIARWVDIQENHLILKTDLFAEAFCLEQFFYDIASARNVVGIDISAEIVKKARTQAARYGKDGSRFLCCDLRHLPLQDGSIDIIISDSSLDHFSTEVEIAAALNELGRVLKAGGILVLSIDNKNNLTYLPYFMVKIGMRLKLTPYFVGRSMSLSRLRQTLEAKGLKVVESTAIFHYPHPDRLVRGTERLLCRVGSAKLDNLIRKTLAGLENLGRYRTRYLTGRYIAVKAVKL
jgi:SAM-dependent methyltransferase